MYNIFLTEQQKKDLSEWTYVVIDNSITTKLFTPMYNFTVGFVPEYIAPNVLTISGFGCVLLSYIISLLCNNFIGYVLMAFLTFAYMLLDAIDGKHARNTGNSSPLGEYLDHSCDNISTVFMIYIIADLIGFNSLMNLWLLMNISQQIFMSAHIDAYINRVVVFDKWTGPGEFLVGYILLLLINAIVCTKLNLSDNMINGILIIAYVVVTILTMKKISNLSIRSRRNSDMLYLLLVILSTQIIYRDLSYVLITKTGLVYAMITGDIIVSKMAVKDFGRYLLWITLAAMINDYVGILLAISYYVIIIAEFANYLKLDIFRPKNINKN